MVVLLHHAVHNVSHFSGFILDLAIWHLIWLIELMANKGSHIMLTFWGVFPLKCSNWKAWRQFSPHTMLPGDMYNISGSHLCDYGEVKCHPRWGFICSQKDIIMWVQRRSIYRHWMGMRVNRSNMSVRCCHVSAQSPVCCVLMLKVEIYQPSSSALSSISQWNTVVTVHRKCTRSIRKGYAVSWHLQRS